MELLCIVAVAQPRSRHGSDRRTALLTTRLALQAKRSVLWLSSTCTAAGVMLQMMAVLALPPREGCRMRVSLLSR